MSAQERVITPRYFLAAAVPPPVAATRAKSRGFRRGQKRVSRAGAGMMLRLGGA